MKKVAYWEHPAVQEMLDRVAENDGGTGCVLEDMLGLIQLGVRFPEIEDGTHDVNEREDELKADGEWNREVTGYEDFVYEQRLLSAYEQGE